MRTCRKLIWAKSVFGTGAVVGLTATLMAGAEPRPGSAGLPLQYLGPALPDINAPDGHLMYSPGVQNIEISRANRTHPPVLPPYAENRKGWTYQHHIGIGCWKGKLYAVWDMTHVGEDNPPMRVVYATSGDGFHWSAPKDLFPFGMVFNLRFYFYHASNGQMLALAAGAYPTHNVSEEDKHTLLVREIKPDHTLGMVYTLIKPGPTYPPVYTESPDAGFVAACQEACNNRPLLEQQDYGNLLGDRKMKWHEARYWPNEDMEKDGYKFGKAFCFYHRLDGTLAGICKMGWVTLSKDGGATWSPPVIPKGVVGGHAKLWAQKTPDGRYAMVYIPQEENRWPEVVTTSNDGITYRDMRVVHGEVPPQRYVGRSKDLGPQYLRGVAEWGGDAPSLDPHSIWVIYSVDKEDIWVSRIPVPIQAGVTQPVNDTFDQDAIGPRVPGWNTYSPLWAPVSVAGAGPNHYLELEDREPVDYARAIRVFPVSRSVDVSFQVVAQQDDRGRLEIELLGGHGQRPVRVVLNEEGEIQAVDARRAPSIAYAPGLIGTFFNKPDFREPHDHPDTISHFDEDWGKSQGTDWSARWTGLIDAPTSGEVEFSARVTDGLRLKIGDKTVIDGLDRNGPRTGKVTMERGRKTPITLEFTSGGGKAALHLSWAWAGHRAMIVPASAVSHETAPEVRPADLGGYQAEVRKDIAIHADCADGTYSLTVDGKSVLQGAKFAEGASELYALSLRTGKFRGDPGSRAKADIPNTEEPSPPVSYHVDDVKVDPVKRASAGDH